MTPNPVSIVDEKMEHKVAEKPSEKTDIVWFNVLLFTWLHTSALYGVYQGFTAASLKSVLFAYVYATIGLISVTAGSHRLWSHRTYKAKLPLRILLCCGVSIAAQNDIYEWSRDHRVHHKFTETNADPHNIKKGFFFAHMGWLMCKKHPDVINKGKTVNCDDLWADPVVRFHRRFYIPMMILFCFYLPTMIPYWMWNESLWNAYFLCAMSRYCLTLNFTWLVNSAAHKYGNQPYDTKIEARENAIVSFLVNGEGWHNYHHAFPWDYAASELGYTLNLTKRFIDFMARLGQAYDMKTTDPDLVRRKMEQTGDNSRVWRDKDINTSEVQKVNEDL